MSDASPLPWFPFEVSSWMASPAIARMLPEQEGAYLRLLLVAWGKGDVEPSLPADQQELATLSKLGARWRKLGYLVVEQFEERNGRLVNAKQVTVWRKQQAAHAATVKRASAGGKANAARFKTAPGSAASTSPSAPQEVLGDFSGDYSGSANKEVRGDYPAPTGAGDSPSAPAALAPAGARAGTGDYLDKPAVREALLRRGIRPSELPAAPDVAALDARLAAERERAAAHYEAVRAAARRWMRTHKAEAKEIGRICRLALGFAVETPLTGFKADALERDVVTAISDRHDWPDVDAWDGCELVIEPAADPLTAGATP